MTPPLCHSPNTGKQVQVWTAGGKVTIKRQLRRSRALAAPILPSASTGGDCSSVSSLTSRWQESERLASDGDYRRLDQIDLKNERTW
jgi:hypothetical protein